MNTVHQITHLIHADPRQAREQILAAFKASGMHKSKTALALGCGHATMLRWISQLDLEREIEAMNERAIKEGWHHGSPCSICGGIGHNARTCGRAAPEPKPRAARKPRAAAASTKPRSKAPRAKAKASRSRASR